MTSERGYACRACENWTLHEEPPGSYTWCPVCGWTDRSLDIVDDVNALLRARINVAENGYSDASRPGLLRAPTSQELNPAGPPALQREVDVRDAERASITAQIRDGFASVAPEGRVDLRGAVRRDYYGEDVAIPVAEWTDDDQHWWDIPDHVLDLFEQHSSVFSFGNAASFRYYLPAYLSLDLRTTSSVGVGVLSRKEIIDDGEVVRDPLALVTNEQRVAAVAYLKWVAKYAWPDSERRHALKALLRWDNSD